MGRSKVGTNMNSIKYTALMNNPNLCSAKDAKIMKMYAY